MFLYVNDLLMLAETHAQGGAMGFAVFVWVALGLPFRWNNFPGLKASEELYADIQRAKLVPSATPPRKRARPECT